MKLKKVAIGIVLNLALLSTAVHADIIFQAPSVTTTENVCDNVAGVWSGLGVISTKVLGKKITCNYKGVAHVDAKSTPYTYTFNVEMTLVSGICPEHENEVLPGACDPKTGAITLKSTDADLSGSVSPDGKSANLSGTVNISVKGKKVSANVEKMDLKKQ